LTYVYDASYASALIIPDEENPEIDKGHRAVKEDEKIFAPQLFWYEVANIFNNLLRRKRYILEEVISYFPKFSSIDITTDFEIGVNYSQKIFNLSNKYNLSSYDAAYLELADRKKAVLCTLDDGLISAAKKHGVAVINYRR